MDPATAASSVTDNERARVAALVRRHLGFGELREGQADVLVRALRGEDVLAIMPTGGGKSICYQLPAFADVGGRKGVTLVVSPLIALMKDQLEGLPPAWQSQSVRITSELHPEEARRLVEEVAGGRYRLVYVAPERLAMPAMQRALRRAGVARVVIDEAHCVSVWGHDFRPDYLALRDARAALGGPQMLAFTATAPPRVEEDIQRRLGPLTVVRASLHRPNLQLEAIACKNADDKLAHLHALCTQTKGPGVVYAGSRAKTEQLAAALQAAGFRALAYHAGLPDRAERQDAFMRSDVDILVATIAFGMGVDKGDVRFVLHHDPSSSLENYAQEAGRAGRDGKPARCVVLAMPQDGATLKQRARMDLPSRDLIQNVWALVLNHFDDKAGDVVVPLAELMDLGGKDNEAGPRIALSILTEAGALERLADVPLKLRVRSRDGRLARFETGGASVRDVAQALGSPVAEVEPWLVAAEARGELSFQTSGRGVAYRMVGDLSRVEDVLERYVKRAEERVDEMMAYVKSKTCRARTLRAHLGDSDVPASCGHCDVCLSIRHEADDVPGSDDGTASRAALVLLSGVRGIGAQNLVWALRGDARAPEWCIGREGYGALAFRSESKVRAFVDALERAKLVEREALGNGGVALRLTHAGAAALLKEDVPLAPSPRERPSPRPSSAPEPTPLAPADEAAFERLRQWRRDRADADGVPPYVVAHDATLRAIAEGKPTTREALLEVKGMGPKRVEKYGEEILRALSG